MQRFHRESYFCTRTVNIVYNTGSPFSINCKYLQCGTRKLGKKSSSKTTTTTEATIVLTTQQQ
ncbi:hypothetical protein DOY81_002498 [Sarcophaga bullata]|nr:hypothetical protein DOY81_002498 [Sarcophaga bullata]